MLGAASLEKAGERKRPRLSDSDGRRHQAARPGEERAKIPARSGLSERQAESRGVPWSVANARQNDQQ